MQLEKRFKKLFKIKPILFFYLPLTFLKKHKNFIYFEKYSPLLIIMNLLLLSYINTIGDIINNNNFLKILFVFGLFFFILYTFYLVYISFPLIFSNEIDKAFKDRKYVINNFSKKELYRIFDIENLLDIYSFKLTPIQFQKLFYTNKSIEKINVDLKNLSKNLIKIRTENEFNALENLCQDK